MQEFKSSETMHFLRNSVNLKDSGLNFRGLALFCQVYKWLQTSPCTIDNYEKRHKVNVRRKSLNLNLFRKIDETPENELKILKTFPVLSSPDFIACFIRDAIIPFLVDSVWALKSTNIFLHNQVIFFNIGDSSPNENQSCKRHI